MKHYVVKSKGDDYGACRTEIVQTTEHNAKQYYDFHEIQDDEVATLKKYLYFVPFGEEAIRDDDARFYGN